MRILALDIGSGTEDVLVYDDSRTTENCVKMVLPSPSLVYSKRVSYFTKLRSDLFVRGDTIGGGQFVQALKRHLNNGLRVFITERAAYSVRNKLDEVRADGFQIVSWEDPPPDFEGETLDIQEVNISRLQAFLGRFEEDVSDLAAVAVAVQDHGVPENNLSNRRFRIDSIRKKLIDRPRLESLAYSDDEIPEQFIRMKSAARVARSQLPEIPIFLMDTSIAAILGCLEDPKVRSARTTLLANIGNEHVTAAIVSRRRVLAMLEHHTSLIGPTRLEALLKAFIKRKVEDDMVFKEGGHGAFYTQESGRTSKIDIVAVTGPNRARLQRSQINPYFAAPGGDMMMTGPMGLVRATKTRLPTK